LGVSEAAVRRAEKYAALSEEVKDRAIAQGVNVTALLREKGPTEARQIDNEIAEGGRVSTAAPLRNLVGVSGGEFARWIKITTPNDRPHVIRVLETAAAILRDDLEGRNVA
jgi:hypothetical protein